MRAVARGLAVEDVGIAVEAGRFGEQAAHIVAGAIAQDERRAPIDDGEVTAIEFDGAGKRRNIVVPR